MRFQALAVALIGLALAGPLGAAAVEGACAPCCEATIGESPCHGPPPPECLREAAKPCCRAQPALPASPTQRAALDAPALAAPPAAHAAALPPAPRTCRTPDGLARGPSPLRLSVVLRL